MNGFHVTCRGNSIWKSEQHLFSLNDNRLNCPKCQTILQQDQIRIPVDGKHEAIIPARYCTHCNKTYVIQKESVTALLRDNSLAKDYTIDGRVLWNVSERERRKRESEQRHRENRRRKAVLHEMESAVVMLCIRFQNHTCKEYIIANDPKKALPRENILHYSSSTARELLTAAFYEGRNREGVLNDERFYVEQSVFEDKHHKELLSDITPTKLSVRPTGGLCSSLLCKRREIVDVLLHSPYTDRYEIIKATYDTEWKYCFADICLYRNFVEKYGNPEISLAFEQKKWAKGDLSYLNAESILKGYGYSVSKKDGLSSKERHDLLADLIDLSLLPQEKILRLLEFDIKMHPQEKDCIARAKWSQDMLFVENYHANPSRFLIAKNKAIK